MLIIWRSLPKMLKCCPTASSLMQLQNPEWVILSRKSKWTGKKRHLAEYTTQIGKLSLNKALHVRLKEDVSRCIYACTARCTCGHCLAMNSEKESICCKEIAEMVQLLD